MIAGVIMVGMVANAFLCDRGRSHSVLLDTGRKPYKFLGQWIQSKGYEVADDITCMGKSKQCVIETSDEPIVAMKDRLMRYRTCAAGYRRRLYGRINLTQQVLIWIKMQLTAR